MITCLENKFSTLRYLENENTFYGKWVGEVESKFFKEILTAKLKWIKTYQPHFWIIDIKYMRAVDVADQEWLLNTWQNAIPPSIKKIAIIKPLDVYNEMVVETILAAKWNPSVLEVQLFSDYDSSLTWIKEKPEFTF
jgi:hypothetical protein